MYRKLGLVLWISAGIAVATTLRISEGRQVFPRRLDRRINTTRAYGRAFVICEAAAPRSRLDESCVLLLTHIIHPLTLLVFGLFLGLGSQVRHLDLLVYVIF